MARNHDDDTVVEKGAGLARGPALVMGTILLAFGLIAIIGHHAFPSWGSNFPGGDATGTKFIGLFELNGWTNWLVMVCGGALLFGSAQHLLAKTMSLVVGAVLVAAAIIALISGDILGVGASNFWTWLGLGVAGVVTLLNVLAPRRKHERSTATATDGGRPRARREAGPGPDGYDQPAPTGRPADGEPARSDRAADGSVEAGSARR